MKSKRRQFDRLKSHGLQANQEVTLNQATGGQVIHLGGIEQVAMTTGHGAGDPIFRTH